MVSLEQFEELRLRLVAYEAQQELGQTKMKSEVKEQVSEVTDGLKELYKRRAWQLAQSPHELTDSRKRSAEEEQCRVKGVCCITKT